MLSIYPINDEAEDSPNWREDGYYDNSDWLVTYQRNKYSLIEELFFGSKQAAIEVYDKFIEDWG